MTLKQYLDEIVLFIQDYLKQAHSSDLVLGLSGGVDSTLVAALAKKAVGKEHLHCVMLPIHSNPLDLKDALEIAKHLDINYDVVDASETYDTYIKDLKKVNIDLCKGSQINLKVRIRMSILYAIAQNYNALVLGTDNMDERYTGYFTKYGDGACDLLPIVHLTKGEVVEACILLGIPEKFARRVPTAGLFEGQTDEGEMGITYKDLDAYLLGNREMSEETIKRIERLHSISEHKRKEIPTPKEFIRWKRQITK